jgi:hypothetical protein
MHPRWPAAANNIARRLHVCAVRDQHDGSPVQGRSSRRLRPRRRGPATRGVSMYEQATY